MAGNVTARCKLPIGIILDLLFSFLFILLVFMFDLQNINMHCFAF